jgi:hypothetical protein
MLRVEGLKQRMAPTIHSLDNMACKGVDKINHKVASSGTD